ncbi:MAG TPA: tetratricopeptide repeat protein [Pyrinomonadaceae bacterium]|jgi:soluble lytic murein transglycosylase|nr:tetratricopeptide repeat protein [Pyrinomonadaceae bacterium]
MSPAKSKQNRLRFALLLCFLLSLPLQAQTPRERHEKIRAAVEGGDYATAIEELNQLRSREPSVFTLNNYDYLLARLAEKRGDMATAAAAYQQVRARNSLLTQYALWHLARFARSTGNLLLEREHLRQLIATTPTTLLREAALARLGESFLESGDYTAATVALGPRARADGPATAREALLLVGQAKLRSGQAQAAREIFDSLIAKLPDPARPDDFALAAVRGLDLLDSGSAEAAREKAPQLPETEHLRRAGIYSFNRDFEGARRHYLALVERYAQTANLADALYQIARGFYQERRFEEAINYFQRVTNEYPASPGARDALSFIASAYVRMKRTDDAVAAFRRFIEKHPDAPNPERPYLNIIDALREVGRDAEALDWIQQTRARFKGQVGAALALFSQAKIHLTQGDWARALSDIDALRTEADLGGMRVPGGTNQAEVAFMRAYTLEQLGRMDEAISAYLEIPDGRNEYYGGRATRRLRALAGDARAQALLDTRLKALRADAQGALSGGQAERARLSLQRALRLTEDTAIRGELLEMARRAYGSLPAYSKFPAPRFLPAGRQALITNESQQENTPSPTHQALADELLFLGLYDEGAPELAVAEKFSDTGSVERSAPQTGGAGDAADQASGVVAAAKSSGNSATPTRAPALSRDAAYTLAVYYNRGELANHAVAFAEPLWKQVPSDFLIELAPREMVELLYPAPYRSALLESAPPRGVDPRFVLAIMRQESRFRPEAKSVSAARGLLQFIPSTADEMAAQLGLKDFSQDDLYNPRTAVLFGSQYMGNLFKLFPGQPQAVAASYNGGEDNVARWLARARTNDPDRYVLEIGFTQAKDYVFKIMPNYWVYQSLYTERLERR